MRFTYIGFDKTLQGRQGNASEADGFADPESVENGAYLFQADGDECAYYVDPETDIRAVA